MMINVFRPQKLSDESITFHFCVCVFNLKLQFLTSKSITNERYKEGERNKNNNTKHRLWIEWFSFRLPFRFRKWHVWLRIERIKQKDNWVVNRVGSMHIIWIKMNRMKWHKSNVRSFASNNKRPTDNSSEYPFFKAFYVLLINNLGISLNAFWYIYKHGSLFYIYHWINLWHSNIRTLLTLLYRK